MSKIWFCRTCGYEVGSRGRCHACKGRLERSPLPELPPGADDDEVGYRLDDWTARARGRLIVALIEAGVEHRFDEDDLVVAAEDEERADDVVAAVAAVPDEVDDQDAAAEEIDEALLQDVDLLYRSAARLRVDPTDMQADGDVAESSAVVFVADRLYGVDADSWAAIGRVTRRLLAALGADEALEDEIRLQAGILVKLLAPVVDPGAGDQPVVAATLDEDRGDEDRGDEDRGDEDADGTTVNGVEPLPAGPEESVYELPEWLPEQRAQLSVLLDDHRLVHRWDGADLVVAERDEPAVEALFDQVGGVRTDGDDEDNRYEVIAELFGATNRFVNDPDSQAKAADVVLAVRRAEGPTPHGLDDTSWWTIRSRARDLAEAIESEASLDIIFGEASTLRDLLRELV